MKPYRSIYHYCNRPSDSGTVGDGRIVPNGLKGGHYDLGDHTKRFHDNKPCLTDPSKAFSSFLHFWIVPYSRRNICCASSNVIYLWFNFILLSNLAAVEKDG